MNIPTYIHFHPVMGLKVEGLDKKQRPTNEKVYMGYR
jgi:hypothetical protein